MTITLDAQDAYILGLVDIRLKSGVVSIFD